jgi:DNA repair photolyase
MYYMDMDPITPYKGRGAPTNPQNRFEEIKIERDSECEEPDDPSPATRFFRDTSRTLITFNDSPDLPFSASFNPYRGCEHGCIYCYARPYHEYLGLSAGLDFESKIWVKDQAPVLLKKELSSPRWVPQVLVVSGVTDCYQPVERRLEITRACLKILAECRHPVALITKSALIARDADIFQELARYQAVSVTISVTTLRPELASIMEPRASSPIARLGAIEALAKAGIPVGVNVAPIIPGLTDVEVPAILKAARDAGACYAGFTVVRLPHAVKTLFEEWLTHHFPDRKNKVLNRIRDVRGGKLNDPRFKSRMRGEGVYAQQIKDLFRIAKRKAGYDEDGRFDLSTAHFRRPAGPQLELFEV